MTGESELLAESRSRLEAIGFDLVSETGKGRLSRTVEYGRGRVHVLMGLDRGDLFVTLRAPGGSGDYHVGLWESCLDETEPDLGARDFAKDIETLVERAHEIEALVAQEGGALDECLRSVGERVFYARRDKGLIGRDTD